MSRFEQRKRIALRDPDLAAAYAEADAEIRYLVSCLSTDLVIPNVASGSFSEVELTGLPVNSWSSSLPPRGMNVASTGTHLLESVG